MAGREKLADEFKFGIQMRELYFWYASDSDRRFFMDVLREILADDDFFTWPTELPDPDVVFRHPDGTTSRPPNPRAVVKRGSILGVIRPIKSFDDATPELRIHSTLKCDDSHGISRVIDAYRSPSPDPRR